jgi:hypothetical protein
LCEVEGGEFWLEKLQMAGERRLRKLILDSLRIALRVVLISNTEGERGR